MRRETRNTERNNEKKEIVSKYFYITRGIL